MNDTHICDYETAVKCVERTIGSEKFYEGTGNYGDYEELLLVAKAIYHDIINKEIVISTVNRDPKRIEKDLRKYLQHIFLYRASNNRTFQKRMLDQYSFIDDVTGVKVNSHNESFMSIIERIIMNDSHGSHSFADDVSAFRDSMYDKFQSNKDLMKSVVDSNCNVINSKKDVFIACFESEFAKLLSHKTFMSEVSADSLREAFFLKLNSEGKYSKTNKKIREFAESIIGNMSANYGYSQEMALDVIVYALREHVVDFHELIN